MTSVHSDEARMLRESAAALCASRFPLDRVRQLAEQPGAISPEAYAELASPGWLGILVPEARGGQGLGIAELAIVLEELGRALVPGPFWSAATLGVPAIAAATDEGIRTQWLDAVTSGARRVTLALQEDGGMPGPEDLRLVVRPAGPARFILQGVKRFVPDLVGADRVIVVGRGPDGPALFLIDPAAEGVHVEENRVADATSRSGTLRLDGVLATEQDRLGDWDLLHRVVAYGNVGIAALAVAGAQAVFDQAVAYAKQRVQFNVPIGTFQAVQHPLVNLFAEIESARSAYLYAAWAVDHRSDDVSRAVALARITSTAAYRRACTTSLQTHGGIAFTWEHGLHLHLKRAIHLAGLLGTADHYQEIIARDGLGI
jgi:alkylation response protein AidB-like acyl-CoA dehydrogenase